MPVSLAPRPEGAPRQRDALRLDVDDPHVLHVAGEVDVAVVLDFAEAYGVAKDDVGQALAAAGVDVIDLSEATFIDSSVVAVVVTIAMRQRGTRVRVRGATGSPLMTLQVSGLDSIVDLEA